MVLNVITSAVDMLGSVLPSNPWGRLYIGLIMFLAGLSHVLMPADSALVTVPQIVPLIGGFFTSIAGVLELLALPVGLLVLATGGSMMISQLIR